MTPRSRKPVMLALFGNGDQKHFQSNFPELLEEPEEALETEQQQYKAEEAENDGTESKLRSKSENDISSAINNNGLPDASEMVPTHGSSSAPESLTSAFR